MPETTKKRKRRPRGTCTAKCRGTDQQCRNYAVSGTSVCRMHGGAAPQVRRHAAQVVAEQAAAKTLAKLGHDVDPIDEPVTELLLLLGRMKAVENVLWDKLDSDALDPGTLAAYQAAAEQLGRFLAGTAKLGIATFQVRIEHAKAQVLAGALQLIFRDLELSPDQRAQVPDLVRRHLLALPEATVDPS